MKTMRSVACAIAAAGLAMLSACNTIEGVGKDITTAGDTISGASRDARRSHSHNLQPPPAQTSNRSAQ